MLHLKHCSVEWTDYGARTVFPDGAECSTWPHPDDPDYHLIADRLGYGRDVLAFAREHDLAHILAEQWIHDRPSRVLRAVADGHPLTWPEAAYEEMAAQQLQALARLKRRPIIGGFDWKALRLEFLGCTISLRRGLQPMPIKPDPAPGSTGPRPGY